MFKRRKQHPVLQRLAYLIWPRTGWSRAMLYLWHRIARLRGTPHSIAAGLASGAAVSFTPMVGIHFVLAAITGSLTRGNLIAAMIGTGVGNPWTFPFIWIWIYHLGRKILGQSDVTTNPDFLALFTGLPVFLLKMLVSFEVDIVFFHKIWVVWAPMAVGAIPTFFAAWIAAYLVTKPLLAAYQTQRIARRSRRRKRERAAREQAANEQAPNGQPRKFGSAGS